MKSRQIMMWRFVAAPEILRKLHRDSKTPDWLVFVPRALSGADLDDAILHKAKPGQVTRHETPAGDVVYMGTAQMDRLSQDLASSTRPSAMAATHSRRK